MRAYKLLRVDKKYPDKLFPLFIDKYSPLEVGIWLTAKDVPTKGYSHRPGWHTCKSPVAPHLMSKTGSMLPNRVWVEVEIRDSKTYKRPINQGGEWMVSNKMKIVKILGESI